MFLPSECWPFSLLWLSLLLRLVAVVNSVCLLLPLWRCFLYATAGQSFPITQSQKTQPAQRFVFIEGGHDAAAPKWVSLSKLLTRAASKFPSLPLSLSLGCLFISISILARISLSLWIKLCDQFKSYARNHNAAKTGCSQLRLCQCNNKVQSHFPTTARAKLNYELQE